MWLNGNVVFEGKTGAKEANPDQMGIDVSLVSGTNRLVIEMKYQGSRSSVFARFLDPSRQLRYRETDGIR